jgi:hypothetical protein
VDMKTAGAHQLAILNMIGLFLKASKA